ncbi:MAG: (2Fe-2S)-binding protein, partial [Pseudomonadota bacterium]|nr:(2Fe-2S)-binding protein [Pseudomonadota bacterium]
MREDLAQIAETLLDYAENGETFQTDKITTVPSGVYTDADLWQKEMDAVFKKLPLALAASAELPDPGNYKAMEAVGLPILITRDKNDQVHAFL